MEPESCKPTLLKIPSNTALTSTSGKRSAEKRGPEEEKTRKRKKMGAKVYQIHLDHSVIVDAERLEETFVQNNLNMYVGPWGAITKSFL